MERNDRKDSGAGGPYARERESLVSLKSVESWTVSDGEPDIRGWEIRTVSGRMLGSVADLLVEPDSGEIALVDVDLPDRDRHTFVPIRLVQIDRTRRFVLMDSADLPDSDLARSSDAQARGRRTSDNRTVRYPRSDREVVADRAPLADAAPTTAAERRQVADRRKIERVSTDF